MIPRSICSGSAGSGVRTARRMMRSARQQRSGKTPRRPQRRLHRPRPWGPGEPLQAAAGKKIDVAAHAAQRGSRGASNSSGSNPSRRPEIALCCPYRRGRRVECTRASARAGSSAASGNWPARSGARRRSTKPGQWRLDDRRAAAHLDLPVSFHGSVRSRQQIAHHGRFGPVNLVAGVAGEKGAVAAVARLNQRDMRVGEQRGVRLRQRSG